MTAAAVLSCDPCAGKGVVRALDLTSSTRAWRIQTCPVCAGTGAHIVKEVGSCSSGPSSTSQS